MPFSGYSTRSGLDSRTPAITTPFFALRDTAVGFDLREPRSFFFAADFFVFILPFTEPFDAARSNAVVDFSISRTTCFGGLSSRSP